MPGLHATLKKRAEVSAEIFPRLLYYFPCIAKI